MALHRKRVPEAMTIPPWLPGQPSSLLSCLLPASVAAPHICLPGSSSDCLFISLFMPSLGDFTPCASICWPLQRTVLCFPHTSQIVELSSWGFSLQWYIVWWRQHGFRVQYTVTWSNFIFSSLWPWNVRGNEQNELQCTHQPVSEKHYQHSWSLLWIIFSRNNQSSMQLFSFNYKIGFWG